MIEFSEHIRNLRETLNFKQREVAAFLKTDTAFICKFEKGERRLRREQVLLLAEMFNADKNEMLSLWLAEKVYDIIKDEDTAKQALKVAENKIEYKSKSKKQ